MDGGPELTANILASVRYLLSEAERCKAPELARILCFCVEDIAELATKDSHASKQTKPNNVVILEPYRTAKTE